MNHQFLPVSKEDLKQRGIDRLDFVYITGDAYVDHPSFGHADHRPSAGIPRLYGRDPGTAGLEGQGEYHCDSWRDRGLVFL